jgi:signal transduction histidine kinase
MVGHPVLLLPTPNARKSICAPSGFWKGLRNVVLLERPIRLGAALSLIRSAMRGRQRQYELRDLLKAFADAREDAETANRLKDEFLATLSHELRTPLNAILGWTTMLRDGNVQPRHVMRALDTIHRNATAQVQIVNDLLDVSRIVRGNVQLSPRVMSLGPLLTLAVESITPTAEAKGVIISTSLGQAPAQVWADHDRLQQVFWNLLSNAVKFTSNGGRVDVTMIAEGSEVRVDVADTGNGIAPAFPPARIRAFPAGRWELDALARRARAGPVHRASPRRAPRRPHDRA